MYPFGTIYNIAFKTIKICERIHPLSGELPHLVQGKRIMESLGCKSTIDGGRENGVSWRKRSSFLSAAPNMRGLNGFVFPW